MGMRVFCVFGWVVNGVVGSSQKQKRKRNAESFARKRNAESFAQKRWLHANAESCAIVEIIYAGGIDVAPRLYYYLRDFFYLDSLY